MDLRRAVRDLGEAHDRDHVVHLDLTAVDLLQEVDHLIEPAELRIVVLDVAGGEVLDLLDLDAVDHGVEDLLPRRMLESNRNHHDLALAILLALVAEANRGGLAAALQLVDEDGRVEVEDEHAGQPSFLSPVAIGRSSPCPSRPGRPAWRAPPRAVSRAPPRPRGRDPRAARTGSGRGRSSRF